MSVGFCRALPDGDGSDRSLCDESDVVTSLQTVDMARVRLVLNVVELSIPARLKKTWHIRAALQLSIPVLS